MSDYYLKNEILPIFKNDYLGSSNELRELFSKEGATEIMINPDDQGAYYVIDLSKLDNLTLKYGISYKNWSSTSTPDDYKDVYIINNVTDQVYYAQDVAYNGDVYFTRNSFSVEE